MTTMTTRRATIADLMKVDGKAELIGGRIVKQMSAGRRHNLIAGDIYVALRGYSKSRGGEAFTDNMTFAADVPSTDRQSFSPDVAFYSKPLPSRDDEPGPIYDAPTFAVEVRNDDDYGPVAERRLASKRIEYFEAGTQVVWDIDPEAKVVRCYRDADPKTAVVFELGDAADAEPAVPGWRVMVRELFG